jgi:hypothetical protein
VPADVTPPATPDLDAARLREVRSSLSSLLLRWSVTSLALGGVIWLAGARHGSSLAVGVGRQAVAWGGIDLVIAAAGRRADRAAISDGAAQTRTLRRLLWVNSLLDVGYFGVAVAMSRRRRFVPDAVGIAIQAVALLVLDSTHARRLRQRAPATPPLESS